MPIIRESARAEKLFGVLSMSLAYGIDFVSAFMVGLPRGTKSIEDTKARYIWLVEFLKSCSS